MSAIPTRRNITIHFSDDELDLLTEFNKYCKTSYETKSGWIKRRIYSELTEHKNKITAWTMKRVEMEETTYQMVVEMSKKQRLTPTQFLDNLLTGLFVDMKRTGRPVLRWETTQ